MSERRNGTRRLYSARPEGPRGAQASSSSDSGTAARSPQTRSREGGATEAWTQRLRQPIVERTLSIDASPETVWEFFVDPEKLTRWKGIDADVRAAARRHSTAARSSRDTPRAASTSSSIAPNRLVFTWGWENEERDATPGSSTVEIELAPRRETARRLHFVHTDLPSARRRSRMRTAGITTCRASRSLPPAAIRVRTRGSRTHHRCEERRNTQWHIRSALRGRRARTSTSSSSSTASSSAGRRRRSRATCRTPWSRRRTAASAAASAQSPDGNGHVTFYVGTDDPQATLDKAEQLGGKTILPVTELPEVTIALFADPEGHVVGLAKGM